MSHHSSNYYVLTTTNQAVTHIREYASCGQSMYATRTLPAGSPCTWQPFMLIQHGWIDPTTPKK
jgi:hypothetical protein